MALVYNIGGPNSNFSTIAEIDSTTLTQGDNTIQIYPGTHAAPTSITATDLCFRGMGNRDDVIIDGAAGAALGVTLSDSCSGSITFENLTIKGQDNVLTGNPAGANAAVTKSGNDDVQLIFRNCKFTNAEHAVIHNGIHANALGVTQVEMHYCDAQVDKAIVSNSNVFATFSTFGANAYHTAAGAATPSTAIKTMLCGPNTANVGNATETILATIA